jgi:transposase
MDARKIKAEQIAASGCILRADGAFLVPSQSGKGAYKVQLGAERSCTCEDFLARQEACKHILAVEYWLANGEQPIALPVEKVKRRTYPQDWGPYNAASTNEPRHFRALLADLCATIVEPAPKPGPGRKPISLRDLIFCAVYKVWLKKASRTASGDLDDLIEKGFISRAPSFNTILNVFDEERTERIALDLLHQRAAPLAAIETGFAFDSSGFSTARYESWNEEKWGNGEKSKARWVKIHIACGVKTHVVTAFLALEKDSGDAPQFPELVRQTAEAFTIKEGYADKAYASEDNFQAMADVGATAYIPFKSNATGGIGGLFKKNFHFFSFHREEFMAVYHRRSNIESTLSGVKRKFGEMLLSKEERPLRVEAIFKLICWNIWRLIVAWYELGIEPVFDQGGAEPDEPQAILKFPPCA